MQRYEKERLLLSRKFPDFRELRGTYNGDDPEQLARIADFQELVEQLKQMSLQTLDELCIEAIHQQEIEQEEAARRQDQLTYFSRSDSDANFRSWCALKKWTIDEATALLLGKDPSRVTWDGLRQLTFNSIFVREYQKLRNQLLRANADGKFADGDAPAKFVHWARDTGLPVPDGLNVHDENSDAEAADALTVKERESVLKLIVCMAMKHYDYVAGAGKNTATKRIVADLDEVDLHLDEDTVRKYLKAGAALVEQNRMEK